MSVINNRNIRLYLRYYLTPELRNRLPQNLRGVSLNDWDVSRVTDMSNLFDDIDSRDTFNEPIDRWNVSRVIDMQNMFENCSNFNQPLNSWNVSRVRYMPEMFSGCTSFNQPLDRWNVSRVTNMGYMFQGCVSFNQSLNSWNVSRVVNMPEMFSGCTSFNQPLDNWNTSQVTNMSGMFQNCTSFNQSLNEWNIDNVRDFDSMFEDATSFNQVLIWNISNEASVNNMFLGSRGRIERPFANDEDMMPPLPQRRVQPPRPPQMNENQGRAFEVHNKFDRINFNRLIELINNGTLKTFNLPITFNEYVINKFETLLNNYEGEDKQDLITKFNRFKPKIETADVTHIFTNKPNIINYFYTVIEFLDSQGQIFRNNYIRSFINENFNAYDETREDPTSCTKGIFERIIMTIPLASIGIGPSYEEINKAIYPENIIGQEVINSFTQVCLRAKHAEPDFESKTPQEKQSSMIECIQNKIHDAYPEVDMTQIQPLIDSNVTAIVEMLGGKRRRTRRHRRPRYSKKTKKVKKNSRPTRRRKRSFKGRNKI